MGGMEAWTTAISSMWWDRGCMGVLTFADACLPCLCLGLRISSSYKMLGFCMLFSEQYSAMLMY